MLCYTTLWYSRPCYAMLTLPCVSRGGAGLPGGPLVVPWWLQAGLPHHRRLAGAQHDAASLHRLTLPTRDGVPLPQGGLRPSWCVSLHQAAATFNVLETSPGRRSADLQKYPGILEVWLRSDFLRRFIRAVCLFQPVWMRTRENGQSSSQVVISLIAPSAFYQ